MTRSSRLKIVTYNIRRCRGMDWRLDPPRIAQVLRRLDGDIIGLQEVAPRSVKPVQAGERQGSDAQLDFLAAATGFYRVAGPTLLHPDAPCGTALLSRYPIRAVRRHDLSLPGYEPRGALDVDLAIGAISARVVVAHLGLMPGERRQQVDALLSALAPQAGAPTTGLLLVLGDINEWWPGSRLLEKLHRRFGRRPAPRTFPALLPLLALDRIWACGPAVAEPMAVTAAKPWPAVVASDHLPLTAELTLRPPSSPD